ncbi:MAG: type I secretion C-terminal target domain-containing protein, partial [Hyphomicrobiales bacterium]
VGVRAAGGDTTTAVTTGAGSDIAGLHGTLHINANGSYTYQSTANNITSATTDVFVYTIKDGDGDLSTTTLTINLADSGLVAPADSDVTVNEAALDTTTTGADLTHGTVTGSLPSSTTETDATNQLNASGGVGALTYTAQTIVGTYGTIHINADGSYVYTLTSNYLNAQANDGVQTISGLENFTYTVTDSVGNTTTGTITVNIIDDVPTAVANSNNVIEGALLTVTAAAGVLANDVAGADGFAIGGGVVGVRAAGGDTTTAVTTGAGTDIAGLHGTLHLNADGSYTYQSTAHDINANTTDVFVYTIKDGDGDLSTTTLTLNLTNVNDPPVVANTQNWMSSDPSQQTTGTPSYANGYPLLVSIPTDPEGDNLVVTATGTIPAGTFYFNGVSYVALTAGTVLYNPSSGINLLDDLVYRPTTTANDTVNANLSLDVYDGTTHVAQTVGIHEVPPTSLPSDTSQIGNGSSPLTSGNDQVATLSLSQATVNAILADPHSSTVVVYTDFQQTPFATPIPVSEQNPGVFGDSSAGSHREEEVQVEISIGTNHFVVVEADTTAAKFEQSWFFDSTTGLMKATVNYDHIFLLDAGGNATTTTLADYLTAHPPSAGDQWTLSYLDNNGGNYQARQVSFSFFSHDPGDPGITVNGDATQADQIYGTSGVDHLYGNGGNDVIVGRDGNDFLDGGTGNDILIGGTGINHMTGGAGNDTFVIDPSKLALHVADVIADYAPGQDVIDLSDLLQSLGGNAPTTDAQTGAAVNVTFSNGAAHVMVDDNGTAAGGNMVEVASLTGVGVNSAITILYDHTHTHTETVT